MDASSLPWTTDSAALFYRFADWGAGYFGVSADGHVLAFAEPDSGLGVDLVDVVEGLQSRDLHAPLLLRFSGVLAHRLRAFRSTFDRLISEADYQGAYRLVYPIKVNQQRHVCEEIRDVGADLGFGFEVGAKPELLGVLGLTATRPEMPIICNGFKDEEYLRLVVLAAKLGRPITPVIERPVELDILLGLADRLGACPEIGVRARLAANGSGRWEGTSGSRGKFGLTAPEVVRSVALLEERNLLASLTLLHCHIGSQVQEIAEIKTAVEEMAHLYVALRRMGAPIRTIDVGGGLGVDYDGTRSASDTSMDYGLEDYASDVVYRIRDICDEAGEPHPDLLTESGRAAVAYSSVLVVNVLGTRTLGDDAAPPPPSRPVDEPRILRQLRECAESLEDGHDPVSVFHDAVHAQREAEDLFSLGHLPLQGRADCETLFWKMMRSLAGQPGVVDLLPQLEALLADQYYCNFSLFQSLPDAWAIGQRFPITPIHRLNEKPSRSAVVADITCDSDGRVNDFISEGTPTRTLPVHPLLGRGPHHEPYYLGVFLVGAYQETLGDLHNLLGDTHAVHIATEADGSWSVEAVVEGDTTEKVLRYVQYDPETLRELLRREGEGAIRSGLLTVADAGEFRRAIDNGLRAYTYLGSSTSESLHSRSREVTQAPQNGGRPSSTSTRRVSHVQ